MRPLRWLPLLALWALIGATASGAAEVTVVAGVAEDYARNCQGCHRADGMGACGAVPRARGFVGLFTHLPEGRDYLTRVPGVVWAMLDDERLARVLNWMLTTYSRDELAPGFRPFTAEEIRSGRARPLADVFATREKLLAELRARGLLAAGEDGLVSAKCGR